MEYFGITRNSNSLVNKNYIDNKIDGEHYVILMPDIELSEQMTESDTIYVIKHPFDLDYGTLEIPERCVLKFEGGTIENGIIIGDQTYIQSDPYQIFYAMTIKGTWRCGCYAEWFGAKSYDTIDANSEALVNLNNALSFISSSSVSTIKFSGKKYKISSSSNITFSNLETVELDLGTSEFKVTEAASNGCIFSFTNVDNIVIKGGYIDSSSVYSNSPIIYITSTSVAPVNADKFRLQIYNLNIVGPNGDTLQAGQTLNSNFCGIKLGGSETRFCGDIEANISGFHTGIKIDEGDNSDINFKCNISKCLLAYNFGANGAPGSVVDGIIKAGQYFTPRETDNPNIEKAHNQIIAGNLKYITFNCIFKNIGTDTNSGYKYHDIITTEDTSFSIFKQQVNSQEYFNNTASAFNPGCFILPIQDQSEIKNNSTYIRYVDNNIYGSTNYELATKGLEYSGNNITVDGLKITELTENNASISITFSLPPLDDVLDGFTHFIVSLVNIKCRKVNILGYNSNNDANPVVKTYNSENNVSDYIYSYDLVLNTPKKFIEVNLEEFASSMFGSVLDNSVAYFEGKVNGYGIKQIYSNNILRIPTSERPTLSSKDYGFIYYDTTLNQYYVWTIDDSDPPVSGWYPLGTGSGGGGGNESDPIFTNSPAYTITNKMISDWNNKGTVSSVTMNSSSYTPTNGVVDLGKVITSETPVTIQQKDGTGTGNGISSIEVDPNNPHKILYTKAQFGQAGGEPNKIDGITVNGDNVTIDGDKIANITSVVTKIKTVEGESTPLSPDANGVVDLSSQFLTSAPVTSVNGYTGDVNLSIPDEVTSSTVDGWGFGKIKTIKMNSSTLTNSGGTVNLGTVVTSVSRGTVSGSGNAVTDITVSGTKSPTISITKGKTFAEASDLDNYIEKSDEATGLLRDDGSVDTSEYIYNVESDGSSGNGISNITLEGGVLTITKTQFGEEGGEENTIEGITFNGNNVTINSDKIAEIEVDIPQGTVTSVQTGSTEYSPDNNGKVNLGTVVRSITMNSQSKTVDSSGAVDLGTVVTSQTQISLGTTSGNGNAVTSIELGGTNKHTITLVKDKTFVDTLESSGSGNGVSNVELENGVLTVTRANFSTSGGQQNIIEGVKLNGSNAPINDKIANLGTVVTGITMNSNPVTVTRGVANLGTVVTSETQLSKNSTGSGNAVTDISVNNHTITLVKGKTFAEASALDNYIPKSDSSTGLLKPNGSVDSNTYLTASTGVTSVNGSHGAVTLELGEKNVIENITFNGAAAIINNATKTAAITATIPTNSTVQEWGYAKTVKLNGTPYNASSSNGTITIDPTVVTSITMNGSEKSPNNSGVVNLGTVVTSETQLSKGTLSGTGNAVTDISLSGTNNHTITLTKGKNFAEKANPYSPGDFPVFDNSGNLSDSGISPSQYKKVVLCQNLQDYVNYPGGHTNDTLYLIPEVIN